MNSITLVCYAIGYDVDADATLVFAGLSDVLFYAFRLSVPLVLIDASGFLTLFEKTSLPLKLCLLLVLVLLWETFSAAYLAGGYLLTGDLLLFVETGRLLPIDDFVMAGAFARRRLRAVTIMSESAGSFLTCQCLRRVKF